MTQDIIFGLSAMTIGMGATAFMDAYAWIQKRLFGVPSLDYAMVGRWLGHMREGRFTHDAIGRARPVRGERAMGWIAHYAIGVVFAAAFLGLWGHEWALDPTLWPALGFGTATVLAPFLILQPGMGAGVAAARTPQPNVARRRSLVAHVSFGFGLYLAAQVNALWLAIPLFGH
jgi:hypothetical protein